MGVYLYSRLPSAYQEVEYIESSGTQYFSVGNSFKTSYKVVIDFQMTVIGGDYVPVGIHYNNNSNVNAKYGVDCYSSKLQVNGGGGSRTATITEDTNRHTVTINKNTATVEGTDYTINYTDYTFSQGIGVFCYNEYHLSPQYNLKSSNKLYKLDIYDENGNHINDLVPCYRIADSVIGMYDLVNDVFYTNQGTGTFSKGADVTAVPLKNAYIGEYVEPPFTPGANTLAYWTFDDQNTDQITDVSGNGNNLTFTAGTKISYSQLSGSDYYGNFNKSQYNKDITGVSNYTWCLWCKIAQTGQQYIIQAVGIDLIYGFRSGEIEVYDYYNGNTYRSTIKSSTPLDTRMCIGFTKNGSTVTKYYNGSKIGTATFANYNLTSITMGGNSAQGLIGSMNNIILENKVRTDAEMSNYYNITKSEYGIS